MKRLLVLLLLAAPLLAQNKALTLEALYDPKTMTRFGGAIQSGFEWLDDTTFVWPRKDAAGDLVEWRVFDLATGKERPLIDKARLKKAFEDAGVALPDDAISDDMAFDARKNAVILILAGDLWHYRLGGALTRLTSAPGEEEEPTFSPDGKRVAFVRNNNLYSVDLAGRERQLTTDGSHEILNGKLDYVYQEEVYGRGVWQAYWWSPDSAHIAFLRSDERPVPEYTIVDEMTFRPEVRTFDYPKAGDPNPLVSLHIVPAIGGAVVDVDHARYSNGEFLIVDVTWADAKRVTYQVQNREQTWLDLNRAELDGTSTTLFRETTKTWVDPLGKPVFQPDGSFLWQSERTGFRHLYHYKSDGTLIRPVTGGSWEAREVHGSDGRHVYFSGTERTHLGLDVYRIGLDGTGLQRLSTATGTHTAAFNPKLTHYVDKWSDIRTPDQIRVHRNDGRETQVVEANAVNAGFALLKPEFLRIKTSDGVMLDAVLYRPSNFDSAKKYPVYQLLYGGPHAPKVLDKWSGQGLQSMLFLQLIAQHGAIAWVVDNRTASGKGAVSAWPAYKNLGVSELRDYEEAIAWLKSQPYVDGNRVALFGWSYGGFMVAYAMTHSKSFAAGIAGAPVTDWRTYDSIYTERLMLMPQNNPEGYDRSSPSMAAANLHGRLLLMHGTTDDNVHAQNALQFADALQKAGKTFEMMMYPQTRHTVTNKTKLFHVQRTVLDFLQRTILATPSQNPVP
ncbi:MAG TPA: S9 family peptidase [Thermoanaerobaculia bacterium]|nr:S9 family peptidase [Thermoanaerobaculia bacterium]